MCAFYQQLWWVHSNVVRNLIKGDKLNTFTKWEVDNANVLLENFNLCQKLRGKLRQD